MAEREKLEKDLYDIIEFYNKEYSKKRKAIENKSAKILQENIIYFIKRMGRLEKNRWFKFKTKRKLQNMYLDIEYAEKFYL